MPRKRNSLKYDLKQQALHNTKNKKNNNTKKAYKRHTKKFAIWAKERGCKTMEDVTKEVIQAYEEFLEADPKSYQPSTIHTFLSPVCVAVGVPMDEIRKPRRSSGEIIRSRDNGTVESSRKNLQGIREENYPKYARVVSFQKVVGIRRAEL